MNFTAIHKALLRWYSAEKRDLPWRRTKDPYAIWISEIMLQQTRVETVIPYYQRFLSNFPTISALAKADLDQLLNLWAGLGYYSRARNLQAAAQQAIEKYDGHLPSSLEDLRTLKGIGPYTAAAIASIAFDLPYAAIDGNLERVFSRLLALRDNPKTKGKTAIANLGERLAKLGKAGDLNQALMDLSSSVCLPREPRCELCPIAKHCSALSQGIQRDLPLKTKKKPPIELNALGWVIIHNEKLLLARRPAGEWLAGMWDLPWKITSEESVRSIAPFGNEFALCSNARTITKHKIHFAVKGIHCEKMPQLGDLKRLKTPSAEYRWVKFEDLHGVNLPRPSEKALEKILAKIT